MLKTTQNMRTIASAFKNKHKFGLPEYSWHSLYKTKQVPQVKISKVPITNFKKKEWKRNNKILNGLIELHFRFILVFETSESTNTLKVINTIR